MIQQRVQFNVRLCPADAETLRRLSFYERQSKSELIRKWIRREDEELKAAEAEPKRKAQ